MTEKEPDPNGAAKDRRLGDEWLGWKGFSSPEEGEIDEKLSTFLMLAAGSVLILIACLIFGWYLAKPRIDQLSLFLTTFIEWSACVLAVILLLLVGLETTLLLKFRKSVVPHIWAEKLLLSLFAKSVWLGGKFGINKDRVGNSFIKAHNLVVKSHARGLSVDTLLILLPRCLEKETRRQVVERANGRAVQIVTASGGEEARKAIGQYKPSLILAVACERDLVSGIRDVAEKIPVLAVPNKRPEGPCKNTRVRLDAFDDALSFVSGRAEKGSNPS